MAQYKSKYPELGFYVKGERKQFANGVYNTENKDAINVLDKTADAQAVKADKADVKPKEADEKPEAEPPKAEAKPKANAKSKK